MVEANQSGRFWPNLYEPLRGLGSRLSEWLSPASEASSNDAAYRISIELPGVAEEDIELTIAGDTLTVSGEKSESREDSGDTWYFSERSYGSFRRSFRLPPDADGEKAEAHSKNGVLEVTVPRRTKEQTQGKKIQVKSA
jgi:HSP20 family protein